MSSLASAEVAHSPEELAGLVDQGLTNIAENVPADIMTSPRGAGVSHELYRQDGIGILHAMYLGFLVGPHKLGRLFDEDSPHDRYAGIRVVAEEEQHGAAYWQDFALDYWHRPQIITPTTGEIVLQSQQHFPRMTHVVQSLHEAYMATRHMPSNVVDLAQYARSRAAD